MAPVADLLIAPLLLALLCGNDPKQALVQAIAWFDPASLNEPASDETIDFDYDAEDEMTVGLFICRRCFPSVYAGANGLLLHGAHERDVTRYLLHGINAHLLMPVQSLEDARYGPPLECCGIDAELLTEGDELDHPMHRARPLFTLFGVSLTDISSASRWSTATTAVHILRVSLKERPEVVYQDLFWLLGWLFSASGNTLVDWSQGDLWESGAEMPEWTPEEVEFLNELALEAREIMAGVWRGIDALEQDASLRRTLVRNIHHLYRQLDRKGKKTNARFSVSDADSRALARRVIWPERDGDGADSSPDAATGVLSVRDPPAPPHR
jgi:hypothetical protein